jgi:WD40 repeat protein
MDVLRNNWSPYLWWPSWSSDGRLLTCATLSDPQTIEIADIFSGRAIRLIGHSAGINAAAWAPGRDERIATAAWDGTVRLWTIDGKQIGAVALEKDTSVECISWRPCGQELAAVCSNGTVCFLSGDLKRITGRFNLGRRLLCCAWNPGGCELLITTGNGWVSVDANGQARQSQTTASLAVEACWRSDGRAATISCEDGRVWNYHSDGTSSEVLVLEAEGRAVHWKGSELVAVADSKGNVAVLDASGSKMWSKSYGKEVIALRWRPDADSLLVATRGGPAYLEEIGGWHTPSGARNNTR